MLKFPHSLTRFAADGRSPTSNTRCPTTSRIGPRPSDLRRVAAGDDEQFCRRRGVGPAEDAGRNEPLAVARVAGGDSVGGRDRDRAHRDMQCSRFEARDQAVVAGEDLLLRRVVSQHGDHDVPTVGRVAPRARKHGAVANKRFCFFGRAVP